MTAPAPPLLANHETIRAALRRLLVNTAHADRGDLISALALAGDLTAVLRSLDVEESLLDGRGSAAVAQARRAVTDTGASLSYVFSVMVVLRCVGAVLALLDLAERAALSPLAAIF